MNAIKAQKSKGRILAGFASSGTSLLDGTGEDLIRLEKAIRLAYGKPVKLEILDYHVSQKKLLPITAVTGETDNVQVVWLAQNFYSYFLGMKFETPICATLLYPISDIFNELSGSSHTTGAPVCLLPDFVRASYTNEMIETLGVECDSRFLVPIVLRYLFEISQLDSQKILNLCFYPKGEKKQKVIDANYIETAGLLKAVGLKYQHGAYEKYLDLPENSIFEKITIDQFDTVLGGASVVVELKADTFIPRLPFPSRSIFAKAEETLLSQFIKDTKENKFPVSLVPVSLLNTRDLKDLGEKIVRLYGEGDRLEFCWYELESAHWVLNPDFKTVIFNAPNILDAVMTAFFLIKAVDPISQKCFGARKTEK